MKNEALHITKITTLQNVIEIVENYGENALEMLRDILTEEQRLYERQAQKPKAKKIEKVELHTYQDQLMAGIHAHVTNAINKGTDEQIFAKDSQVATYIEDYLYSKAPAFMSDSQLFETVRVVINNALQKELVNVRINRMKLFANF